MAPEDSTWRVLKHLEGTSYHKPFGFATSWVDYWQANSGLAMPTLCPGCAKPLRPGNLTVGCHVMVQNSSGHKRHAIVPACSSCNKSSKDNKGDLIWLCTAVTIADPSKQDFVGRIMLPKTLTDASCYWIEIHGMNAFRDENNEEMFRIEGLTNKSREGDKPRACLYKNPDDFLQELAGYLKRKSKDAVQKKLELQKKLDMILKNDAAFVPMVIICNTRKYPEPNRAKYKEAYGVCTVNGCHKTAGGPKTTMCTLHDEQDMVTKFKAVAVTAPKRRGVLAWMTPTRGVKNAVGKWSAQPPVAPAAASSSAR
uniref:Uncharacterized protein n=1 Tax=Mantoniella antarctica TaxID=81844 RepID=A0A7S0S787_9CHLO